MANVHDACLGRVMLQGYNMIHQKRFSKYGLPLNPQVTLVFLQKTKLRITHTVFCTSN